MKRLLIPLMAASVAIGGVAPALASSALNAATRFVSENRSAHARDYYAHYVTSSSRSPQTLQDFSAETRRLSRCSSRLAFTDKRDDTERGESACDPCACFQFGNFATSLNRKAVFSPFAPIICAAAIFLRHADGVNGFGSAAVLAHRHTRG